MSPIDIDLVITHREFFTFILVKVHPLLLPLLTLPGLFWFHSFAVLTCVIFAFFNMPETRGKTLSELNQIYGGKMRNTQSKPSYMLKFRKKKACGICVKIYNSTNYQHDDEEEDAADMCPDTERKFLLGLAE